MICRVWEEHGSPPSLEPARRGLVERHLPVAPPGEQRAVSRKARSRGALYVPKCTLGKQYSLNLVKRFLFEAAIDRWR
jgi:hypothetical protein